MVNITADNKKYTVDENTTAADFLKQIKKDDSVLAYKVNNCVEAGNYIFKEGDIAVSMTIADGEGYLMYKETIILVLLDAAEQIYGCEPVLVRQSVNKSTYFELTVDEEKSKSIEKLKNKMTEIILSDRYLSVLKTDRETAAVIIEDCGDSERAEDIRNFPPDYVKLLRTAGKYHIVYHNLAYSTKSVKKFDIVSYENGFLLRYPTNYTIDTIPEIPFGNKIHRAIGDYQEWIRLIGSENIFLLNKFVREGKGTDLINLSEGLHEKRISMIADKIKDSSEIKIILIAGPSSSGKTTFANRLCLHLRINHIEPVVISLDNYYYTEDEKMPLDEDGKPDYEDIRSIDYELFNRHLKLLVSGKEAEIPKFDFKLHKRVRGETLRLKKGEIIIVEGIHALNEILTSSIDRKSKYKIYLSALTSLCLDEYNVFSPTDNRLLRRLVRDEKFRNSSAELTFDLWKNVRAGERKYIFPFENEADEVFNSSLVYELAVLKEPAEQLLMKVEKDSRHYSRAQRLIELLSYFEKLESSAIPPTSILREFIGGSTITK